VKKYFKPNEWGTLKGIVFKTLASFYNEPRSVNTLLFHLTKKCMRYGNFSLKLKRSLIQELLDSSNRTVYDCRNNIIKTGMFIVSGKYCKEWEFTINLTGIIDYHIKHTKPKNAKLEFFNYLRDISALVMEELGRSTFVPVERTEDALKFEESIGAVATKVVNIKKKMREKALAKAVAGPKIMFELIAQLCLDAGISDDQKKLQRTYGRARNYVKECEESGRDLKATLSFAIRNWQHISRFLADIIDNDKLNHNVFNFDLYYSFREYIHDCKDFVNEDDLSSGTASIIRCLSNKIDLDEKTYKVEAKKFNHYRTVNESVISFGPTYEVVNGVVYDELGNAVEG